ncbi:MAG: hypothetical protein V4649_03730 [Bacteroidota bacterium]
MLGPTYLEKFVDIVANDKIVLEGEWTRQLKTFEGGTKFKIEYYGERYEDLIAATDFDPALVVAVDVATGQKILLFDGCLHGYNAMFCDTYTAQQITGRVANNVYREKDGNEQFELILSASYQMSEDEFAGFIDESGNAEMLNGTIVSAETAWRNSFDFFEITAVNSRGDKFVILSEELA